LMGWICREKSGGGFGEKGGGRLRKREGRRAL
jgi:hypothetical protein